jgi:hypothetical protein
MKLSSMSGVKYISITNLFITDVVVSDNMNKLELLMQLNDDHRCFVLVTGTTRYLQVKSKIHNNGQLTQQVSSCWYSNNSYFSYATMTL